MEKHYLFIGGSTGIGLQLVNYVLAENNAITVLSRDYGQLPSDDRLTYFPFDVASEKNEFTKVEGAIHGLVYFPGPITIKPVKAIKPMMLRNDFEINLVGFVRSVQAYLPNLKKAEQASVVAFSSVAAQTGLAFHTSIAASKGAVEGAVRAMAAELAPKIRVNAIAPSITQTPLMAGFLDTEAKQKTMAERHPLKRYGQPEDIAGMAHFLLTDKSGWITGQVFSVDGGLGAIRNL